ncbi:DNA (cytosine-5-)-methyltransferase [candidate division KSB1 bacterium]|nr:DNA (cytosine-5-)-methyltransferase [candidate division KSB1 bacterium]
MNNLDKIELLHQKTFLEFFAGIGLMRMGLELAGWSISFANDIAPEKMKMYYDHFHDAEKHFLLCDIHQLDALKVPSATLATASFPCNDLSLAGARAGLQGKNSSAFWGFINVIRNMEKRRPPIVLLENVSGFLTSHKGTDFEKALLALTNLGYSVDALMIDASYFVPQSRVRLFVVGVQRDLLNSKSKIMETLSFYEEDARPKALAKFILMHPNIDWNIRNLPKLPRLEKTLDSILDVSTKSNGEWWSKERADYLISQMHPLHKEKLEKMIGNQRWSYATAFRRVRNGKTFAEIRNDGIAGCLRTPRGGSARQILIKAGYGNVLIRLLSPRECARLMGADNYTIEVNLNQALFGFGDAVVVPVIKWIAENYINPLLKEVNENAFLHGEQLYGSTRK